MEKLDLLIADDHPIFRKGLREIIDSDPGMNVVCEAENGAVALDVLRSEPPDIAVLDVDMPIMGGLDVARFVQQEEIPVEIIFLTMYKEEYLFNKAMDLGIKGYILKESAVTDILHGIRTVGEGRHYISPGISEYLIHRVERSAHPLYSVGLDSLTNAERRVLKLVADNKTTHEIAEALSLSSKTIENHRSHICRKLNLTGTNALLKYAIEHRLKI